MVDDLAARISDGAVAVLDLVPGEQRFHELSRFVLRGGASRFAAAVLDDEPVRYVLPVGIPGRKLDYGTLLIQRSRCALVWRTDPARPYHARIVDLGPETTVSQSPVTIRGEVWGRFDVQHADGPVMTFLVPPVTSTALPRMLHRVLVEQPRSQLSYVEAPPLPAAVTEGADEPAPSPVDPDGPTEVLDAAAIRPAAGAVTSQDAPGAEEPGGGPGEDQIASLEAMFGGEQFNQPDAAPAGGQPGGTVGDVAAIVVGAPEQVWDRTEVLPPVRQPVYEYAPQSADQYPAEPAQPGAPEPSVEPVAQESAEPVAQEQVMSAADEFGLPAAAADDTADEQLAAVPVDEAAVEEPPAEEPPAEEPPAEEPPAEEPYEDLYRTTERVSPPPPPEEPEVPAIDEAEPKQAAASAPAVVYRPVGPQALATPVPPPAVASGGPVAGQALGVPTAARSAIGEPTTGGPVTGLPRAGVHAPGQQAAGPQGAGPEGAAPGASGMPGALSATAGAKPARRLSDGVTGYLIGLVVTLIVGGVFLLAKYLGWLG